MARLIDADALKARIGELCINNDEMFSEKAYERIIGVIDAQPTVTAEPKRGNGTMTNADRIRQMTDGELASILCGQCTCCAYQITDCTEKQYVGCEDGVLEWLKQESEVTE